MTHPLTPREKVRQIIDGALNSAIPEPWEVANHATDAILTALASGSGDHEELARLAEAATPGEWRAWVTRRRQPEIYTDGGPEDQNDKIASGVLRKEDAAFIAAANPATVLSLLAENAALRAAGEIIAQKAESAIQQGFSHIDRATEAERKLAEAVGLLTGLCIGTSTVKVRAVREWLSKEAERG